MHDGGIMRERVFAKRTKKKGSNLPEGVLNGFCIRNFTSYFPHTRSNISVIKLTTPKEE